MESNQERVYPSNPNKYYCIKSHNSTYYRCVYDNFKEIYFKWQLTNPAYYDHTVIDVPSIIPSMFHSKFVALKLEKPVYFIGLKSAIMDVKNPEFNKIFDNLIKTGECYTK